MFEIYIIKSRVYYKFFEYIFGFDKQSYLMSVFLPDFYGIFIEMKLCRMSYLY